MLGDLGKDGFTIISNVFNQDELGNIRAFTDRLIAYANKGLEDPFQNYYLRHRPDSGVLYDVYQRHPIYRSFAHNDKIIEQVSKALGDNIYLYVNSLLYKPKDKINEVPWHQDFLNKPQESMKIIAWMPMDDATKENGCIKVVPGSHSRGFFKWYTVEGETHHDRVDTSEVDLNKAIYVEMKAGDVLLFNNYLLHASDENNSDKPRRAYRVVYKALDDAVIPRSGPIMMKGGDPEYLSNAFNKTFSPPDVKEKQSVVMPTKKTVLKKVLHKIGRKLISY